MKELRVLLAASSSRHSHLCPRQVLGVRAALVGIESLGLEVPRRDKRLLIIAETDGCFVDGIEAASQATVGHRTLRVEDYGKIAATFVDTLTGKAIRVAPRQDIRHKAWYYTPDEVDPYAAQLAGYQVMPENELFFLQDVELKTAIEVILSTPGIRTDCDCCGEEIINQREVIRNGLTLCRTCAGYGYYRTISQLEAVIPADSSPHPHRRP